ncbi:MAG: NAD kinase [Bacteroidetes bacterium]|nr:NAD kinase [Bacteroidota bacterium]MDA1119261.1 NAD kinase [Bacteroidota bacterium]
MRIALHGKQFIEESTQYVQEIINILSSHGVDMLFSPSFGKIISGSSLKVERLQTFSKLKMEKPIDFIFSIGGDGTLLETVTHVGSLGIPILGINTGRLGFLATTAKTDIAVALDSLFKNDFSLDKRTLIRLETEQNIFKDLNFALNEMTVVKNDTSSMIRVICHINDRLLNTYWADGLMISTPTGSTGYSLSCGGPVVLPSSQNFLITPINPHNLNVTPMVVSDSSIIKIEVDSRETKFLTSLDSRSATVGASVKMKVLKESFTANLIKMKGYSFLDTLRNKLNWGFDIRN